MSRRHVGRVIFGHEEGRAQWTVLTLTCHVDNVAKLAEAWDNEKAYLGIAELDLEATKPRLVRAAEIHDSAKPAKFRITYRKNPFREGEMEWGYSFAGHRFEVYDEDHYAQTLARLHHEYSVDGIAQAVAHLRTDDEPHAANLPLDLYTLEMCDQIEATLARAALGGHPKERVFMDFHVEPVGERRYALDPYPFASEVQLTVDYARLLPPEELVRQTETGGEEKKREALRTLTKWVVDALQTTPLKTVEVTVCALVKL